MIRRLWPTSLYGQILLVAAIALLLAQVINTTMLMLANNMRATVEASSMLVARVANQVERQRLTVTEEERGMPQRRRPPTIALVTASKPANPQGFKSQPDLAQRASEYLLAVDPKISSIRLSKGPIANLPAELRDGPMRRWHDGFAARAGAAPPREAVLLSLRLVDGQWVNASVPVRTLSPFPPIALLLQTLTLYLAVLIPLALVARRIARPLNALTGRVRTVGLGTGGELIEPRGPSDLRELIDAFNAAEARLASLLMEKDVMLGAIGHDLKTPLASLRVRIESVDDIDERDKMAGTIDEMVHILDDILIFARLGKSAEAALLTDIGALIEMVVGEVDAASVVTVEQPGEKCRAEVRPVLLRRALRNLIDNALKYGGNARIKMECFGGKVRITIDDQGPGIDPALIPTMFEPFTRAESSRNRMSGGSGLGLTIARAIARAHGGDIVLENRAEGGLRALLTVSQKTG